MVDSSETENFNIYWEKQGRTRLCGLHCINSLLQGPYYEKKTLDEISTNLDELEKKLLGEDLPKDYSNHAFDGNYNIQVISEALKLFGVEIKQLKKSELLNLITQKNDDEHKQPFSALMFNSSTHWFCIRKINGKWINLNSANPLPGPQLISDFYLSAFLNDTWDYGFNHFQVLNLPEITANQILNKSYQNYVKFDVVKNSKPKKINFGDTDDLEMEKAMEESLKNEKAFSFSDNKNDQNNNNIIDEDNVFSDEMYEQMIMQLSINDFFEDLSKTIPKEPLEQDTENAILVSILNLDGKVFGRRFNLENSIQDVLNFCKVNERINDNEIILINLPSDIDIKDIKGIKDKESLFNQILDKSKSLKDILQETSYKDDIKENKEIKFLMKVSK